MNNEELLCAAQVFNLAAQIANGKKSAYADIVENDLENRDALMREWDKANPSSSFVPEAYALLEKVSKKVAEIRAFESM
jgi:hypothetical protein